MDFQKKIEMFFKEFVLRIIKGLWEAFNQHKPHVGGIIKLKLLTAQRRWEVSHMRYQDIDLEKGWWTIPGEFSKNGKSHHVPLTKSAVDLIEALPQKQIDTDNDKKDDSDWVFPSPTRMGQCINNIQKAKQRVDEDAGVEDFVLHDLRRAAASYMAQSGVPGSVIGKILNHAETGVTHIYYRYSYDQEKREALEVWEGKLREILGFKTGTHTVKIST